MNDKVPSPLSVNSDERSIIGDCVMSNESSNGKAASILYNNLAFCIGFCIAISYPALTATALLLSDNNKDK